MIGSGKWKHAIVGRRLERAATQATSVQLGDCNKPPGRTKRPNQMALGVEVVEDAA